MKKTVVLLMAALLGGSAFSADSTPKDDVKDAAKKLGDQENYSWISKIEMGGGGGGRFRPGPTEGKTDKAGMSWLSMTMGDRTVEAALKGGKAAVKTPDEGWKSLAELNQGDSGGGPNPGRFLSRRLQMFKTPAAEAESLIAKTKEIKKIDDSYGGELSEEAVKELLSFRRPGGDGPAPSNSKGSVKFWVKDGMLSKYQYNVKGTVNFNGNDVDIDRTTTVEIKDAGNTKINIPDEAKKKLGS